MIVQPGKPFDDVKSYWPINLLTIFSKIFERFFLKRLVPIINIKGFIPDYQFGFRSQHGTLKHSHRNLSFIRDALENWKFCEGAFLDVQYTFDRVWHNGLLYKLKKNLTTPSFLELKSLLVDCFFYVKKGQKTSRMCGSSGGVAESSPFYTIFIQPICHSVTRR